MRSALIAVLLLLALPATASASEWAKEYGSEPVSDARTDAGLVAAVAYWGQAVGCTPQMLGMRVTLVGDGDPATGPPAAATRFGECPIWVNLEWFPAATPWNVCQNVVHEYGHLLGIGHVADPRDVAGVMTGDGVASQCGSPPTEAGPLIITVRRDGRTRSARNRGDRKWCRRHHSTCFLRYRALAIRSLSRQSLVMLQARHPEP